MLRQATAAGEEAFLAALPEVEPRLSSAGAQGQAVRLALEAGAYRAAQRLADAGARHHPEDPALRRLASVLQPARVRAVPARDSEGVVLAVAWLKREGARYRGRWVALQQGELRASAGSYRELIAEIGAGRDFYVTKVG
ncbi:MAG: hypothetical protein IPG96_08605 [Proteobacteria bacterium]|nr:hypothetical protein [Pseudomonadota bacterium]